MKVLQLTKQVPYPLHNGESIAIKSVADAIVELGHPLYLFSVDTSKHPFEPGTEAEQYLRHQYLDYEFAKIDTTLNVINIAKNYFFSDRSMHLSRFESKDITIQIKNFIIEHDIELLWVESLYMMYYAREIKSSLDQIKVIYRSHNIEYRIWERVARESSIVKNWYLQNQFLRLRKEERSLISHADSVVAISANDLSEIAQSNPTNKGQVLLPRFDIQHAAITCTSHPLRIGFFGAMDWTPNALGLNWFMEKVFSQLNENYRLVIAGRKSEAIISDFDDSRITVLGEISSVNSFYDRVDLCIVPLYSGGGIRIKILEAFSYGVPVLSTSVGCEGLAVHHSQELLIADEASAWLDSLAMFSESPSVGTALARQAQEYLKRHHAKEVIIAQTERILNRYHVGGEG